MVLKVEASLSSLAKMKEEKSRGLSSGYLSWRDFMIESSCLGRESDKIRRIDGGNSREFAWLSIEMRRMGFLEKLLILCFLRKNLI